MNLATGSPWEAWCGICTRRGWRCTWIGCGEWMRAGGQLELPLDLTDHA